MRPRFLAVAALVVAAAGCSGDDDSGPTASSEGAAFLSCVFGSGIQLGVGEVRTFRGEEGEILCVDGGGEAAEFTLVPFFASSNGEARLRVSTLGGNLQTVTGPPNPSLGGEGEGLAAGRWTRDDDFHFRLQERFRREMGARIRTTPAAAPRASRAAAPAAEPREAAVPAVGDLITIRIPQFYRNVDPCEESATRQARVSAVSRRAILVNDPSNPPGGLTDAELVAFGQEFDRLIFPVDSTYFGTPTDLDQNGGRVIIVFTREVNALTPPNSGGGYVGGFFFPGDIFPVQETQLPHGVTLDSCPRSNVGEIFYILAPDPNGAVNGNRFSRELVLESAAGTIAHELEHLINSSRRIYVNRATQFEETWLDEGLAHIAEELSFYATTGLGPRQNLNVARLVSSPAILRATEQYMDQNFGRYYTYIVEPDSNSLLGEDNLPTRGATWAFLRYAADREPGSDQTFFFNLVNTTTAGIGNLARVVGPAPLDWMQDWTVSVYTDDAVAGVEPQYTQPSWNFRDIIRIRNSSGQLVFPLKTHTLASANTQTVNLRGGGAAFLRFGILPSGRVALRLSNGNNPPPPGLRLSLVRTR